MFFEKTAADIGADDYPLLRRGDSGRAEFCLRCRLAAQSRESLPFLDALFTSASAVCVTGLVVRDTATYFSLFGKLTIITLIQIGGVGVVTLAVTFAVATGRKLRLSGQNTMLESVSAEENSGAWRYARFILLFSLAAGSDRRAVFNARVLFAFRRKGNRLCVLPFDIGVLQRGVRSDGRGNGTIFVFDGVCRFAACQFYDLRADS